MTEPVSGTAPARVPENLADTIKPTTLPAEYPGAALAYRDGPFAWPEDQIHRFAKLIGITVTGNPALARHAREVDLEKLDATVEDVPPFLDARAALGRRDGTVYCSRATLPALFGQLGQRRPRLHIATLDNRRWTPAELAADIKAGWNLDIDPAWIWAIQCYKADPAAGIFWDTSLVYGEPDFWHPGRAEPPLPADRFLCPEPLRDHKMPDLHNLAVMLRGSGDSFTGDLLRLMRKADPGPRQALARAFPVESRALDAWETLGTDDDGSPTFGQVLDALTAGTEG